MGAGLVLLASLLIGSASAAQQADVVYVRKSCWGVPAPCYTLMTQALSWLWGLSPGQGRQPSAGDRVILDIGPGEFNAFNCPRWAEGFVTVRGAGREITVIKGETAGGSSASCTDLEFMDLRFEGEHFGFVWSGDGDSTWTDVDIIGTLVDGDVNSLGWADDDCSGTTFPTKRVHYFFGSRIAAHGTIGTGYPASAFWGECSEVWFFGGEISWFLEKGGTPGSSPFRSAAITLGANSDFRAFGTAVRTVARDLAAPISQTIYGVSVTDDVLTLATTKNWDGLHSAFHIHGGSISVEVEDDGENTSDVVGIVSDGNVLAHTPDTAFALDGPAAKTRLQAVNGGVVLSPFLWPPGPYPPTASGEANELTSLEGQDMFVETDCNGDGICTTGDETHLMLYNAAACPGEIWLDSVTGRCRGVEPSQ